MKPYLLIVEGDVEPRLVGPFPSYGERDQAAREHREKNGTDDGLYRLNAEGQVEVESYGGMELGDG
jgi:hypothetical protein